MTPSVRAKLDTLHDRFEELAAWLATPEAVQDQERFRAASQEYAQLEPLVACYRRYQALQDDLAGAEDMARDDDPEMRRLAAEERERLLGEQEDLEKELQLHLVPKDPDDDKNLYLEIRAGTGGDEAALFAGDLFRMYARYAEARGWTLEVISDSPGEHGGHKEVIARVAGRGAYARLKFESGTHRVQRVPQTESQGRIHTSACTVAVLPESAAVDDVDIQASDLRVDTFRASGAGGQHVNKTDSAIRLTHLPTGIVVECQSERSQHKNRARAMALLKARILDAEQARHASEQAQNRRLQVGSGDRSERIRTYNFPQGRITDHRINLTLYKLEDILQSGALDAVIDPLTQEHQAEQLAAMGE